MLAAAGAGIPVVFFPEGTTSDGNTVLKFHSGVLSQVLEAGESVTAAFVSYRMTEDNGPDASLSNDVRYLGDEVGSMFKLVALRGIEVSVRIADAPIAFSVDATNRKVAAIEARAAVMQLGGVAEREAVAP